MFKKLSDFFSQKKMVFISGLSILTSFIFLILKINIYIDLAWISIIISGYPLFYSAFTRLIFEKWISSALLITIAMISSIYIGEIFAAGEIAFIMAIGGILEDSTIKKARKGLIDLFDLTPDTARIISYDESNLIEKIVDPNTLKLDDKVRVLPGEIVSCDGIIIDGSSSIDQCVITGESIPIDKNIGDNVFAGTMNLYGAIDVKVTKAGRNSSLNKLIDMVKDAEKKKARIQSIADKWSVYLVPISLIIAVLAYIWSGSIERAVTVLVVFCPCALALATPTAIVAAIGQATKYGVIIKSGLALEEMGKVDTIVFDKTGTLTYAKLKISDILISDKKISRDELLALAASVELKSEHPAAKSIVSTAKERNIELFDSSEFEMFVAKGVKATVKSQEIICGNESLFKSHNIELSYNDLKEIDILKKQGKMIVLVAIERVYSGVIALSDIIRENAKEIVQKLYEMNVDIKLLTGDNRFAGEYFSKELGISDFIYELMPEDKLNKIKDYQNEGRIVSMIGDGVNDAPSLKTANVGISMGFIGTDIAIEASDITLISDDISKIPYLKRLSNETAYSIKFNIIASLVINIVAVTMSILGLLNPITGALVHNIGSVLVVLNAARLYDKKFI